MDKRVFSCCLVLVILGLCASSSEAAAVKKPAKDTDTGGVWSAVAELATRVVRQLADDLSSEDSEEDDDELAPAAAIVKNPETGETVAVEVESEEDDDDDIGFFGRRVKRSGNAMKEHREESDTEAVTEPAKLVDNSSESSNVAAPDFSVLILIRNALKKVTTNLPAEQVASNALHYFQLFEHFLQQTIEQVIADVEDDKEEELSETEANTIVPEKATMPVTVEEDKKPVLEQVTALPSALVTPAEKVESDMNSVLEAATTTMPEV